MQLPGRFDGAPDHLGAARPRHRVQRAVGAKQLLQAAPTGGAGRQAEHARDVVVGARVQHGREAALAVPEQPGDLAPQLAAHPEHRRAYVLCLRQRRLAGRRSVCRLCSVPAPALLDECWQLLTALCPCCACRRGVPGSRSGCCLAQDVDAQDGASAWAPKESEG